MKLSLMHILTLSLLIFTGCGMPDMAQIKAKLTPDIPDAIELTHLSSSITETNDGSQVTQLATLDERVHESSGLISIEGHLFTHNDSGHDARIFEIDRSGNILNTIKIENAVNHDWEDLAQDETYLYIGDIGNNQGDRKDLTVYAVSKNELLTSDRVTAKAIKFHYQDQTRFKYDATTTPYDAEALIAFGDNLYIFTKNWADKTTTLYRLSKESGEQTAVAIASQKLDFYVTGADIDPDGKSIALCGYQTKTAALPSIALLKHFSTDRFFSGEITTIDVTEHPANFRQIESIIFTSPSEILITSERFNHPIYGTLHSALFEISLDENRIAQ